MLTTLETGLDVFFLSPGAERIPACGVCGGVLDVVRGQLGPTSFAAAMAERHGSAEVRARVVVEHDVATCPAASQPWHLKARELVGEANRTASPSVRALIEADLAVVIASH